MPWTLLSTNDIMPWTLPLTNNVTLCTSHYTAVQNGAFWGAFYDTCHHWQFVIHWLLPWQQSMTVLHSQSKSRMSLYLTVNDKLSVMTSFMKCSPDQLRSRYPTFLYLISEFRCNYLCDRALKHHQSTLLTDKGKNCDAGGWARDFRRI